MLATCRQYAPALSQTQNVLGIKSLQKHLGTITSSSPIFVSPMKLCECFCNLFSGNRGLRSASFWCLIPADFHFPHSLVFFWLNVIWIIRKFLSFWTITHISSCTSPIIETFLVLKLMQPIRALCFIVCSIITSASEESNQPLLWLCISKEKGEGIYARWFLSLSTVYGGVNWINLSLSGAEGADIHLSVQGEDHFQPSFRERQGYTLLPVEGYSASLEPPHCSGCLLHKSHREAEEKMEKWSLPEEGDIQWVSVGGDLLLRWTEHVCAVIM